MKHITICNKCLTDNTEILQTVDIENYQMIIKDIKVNNIIPKMNSLSNKEVTPTEYTLLNICRGNLQFTIAKKDKESILAVKSFIYLEYTVRYCEFLYGNWEFL